MGTIRQIFEAMPQRYKPGQIAAPTTYYFSVCDEKWTVTAHPDRCEAKPGKLTDNADCVIKADPGLFEKMVLEGKQPGPLDLARGKLKTSNPDLLLKLGQLFRLGR